MTERKSVAECNLGNTAVERLCMGECCVGFMCHEGWWVARQIALQELKEGKLMTFQTQSSFKYRYPIDLLFFVMFAFNTVTNWLVLLFVTSRL